MYLSFAMYAAYIPFDNVIEWVRLCCTFVHIVTKRIICTDRKSDNALYRLMSMRNGTDINADDDLRVHLLRLHQSK